MDISGIEMIEPPVGTVPGAYPDWTLGLVAYARHPDYVQTPGGPAAMNRLTRLGLFSRSCSILLAKRLIRYDLVPLHLRKPASLTEWFRFLASALKNRMGSLRSASGADSPLLKALESRGCLVVKVERKVITCVLG